MTKNTHPFPYPLSRPDLLPQACWINGQWRGADNGSRLAVVNPATGAVIAYVPDLNRQATNEAIASAQSAMVAWSAATGKRRAVVLQRWAGLLRDNAEDLSIILTAEQGKPLVEARGEVGYAASFLEWFAEEAKRIDGDVLQSPVENQRLLTFKQPVGVCAAITPWNFPAAMITRKAGPALAAGCSMIVKPAEQTPLTALALAVLADEAGIPGGVFQVITGQPQGIGDALCESDVVRKLSFTGSTQVGRLLMAKSAASVKKLSLELGGNAPFIVFDDANLDEALDGLLLAKFRNSGQTCVCANRVYIQAGIYEDLTRRLAEKVGALAVGSGLSPDTQQGPLINASAVDKVRTLLEDAVSHGAKIVTGGKKQAGTGFFFQPTVLRDVLPNMQIAKEEIFGPVAALYKFDSEDEVIKLANDSIYGLAAYLFTNDNSRIWRMSEALEYGMVGINTAAISNEVGPFGGIKQSGLGREGSKYGIEEYLELKYLCMKIAAR